MHALLILILLLPYTQNSKNPNASSPSNQSNATNNPESPPARTETSNPVNQCSTSGQKQADPFWDAPAVTATATVLYVIVTIALCIGVFFQVRAYWAKERAWMMMSEDNITLIASHEKFARFSGDMRNLGQSPAIILASDHDGKIIKREEKLPIPPPYLTGPRLKRLPIASLQRGEPRSTGLLIQKR